MPLNKSAFYRYLLIDKRLNDPYKKPFPTIENLMDYIEEKSGQRVSKRTIEKDIQEIRFGETLNFYAPLGYHPREKGYYYKENHHQQF